ncbi:unnamed protein product, partial [Amoebophrya sp. A120]
DHTSSANGQPQPLRSSSGNKKNKFSQKKDGGGSKDDDDDPHRGYCSVHRKMRWHRHLERDGRGGYRCRRGVANYCRDSNDVSLEGRDDEYLRRWELQQIYTECTSTHRTINSTTMCNMGTVLPPPQPFLQQALPATLGGPPAQMYQLPQQHPQGAAPVFHPTNPMMPVGVVPPASGTTSVVPQSTTTAHNYTSMPGGVSTATPMGPPVSAMYNSLSVPQAQHFPSGFFGASSSQPMMAPGAGSVGVMPMQMPAAGATGTAMMLPQAQASATVQQPGGTSFMTAEQMHTQQQQPGAFVDHTASSGFSSANDQATSRSTTSQEHGTTGSAKIMAGEGDIEPRTKSKNLKKKLTLTDEKRALLVEAARKAAMEQTNGTTTNGAPSSSSTSSRKSRFDRPPPGGGSSNSAASSSTSVHDLLRNNSDILRKASEEELEKRKRNALKEKAAADHLMEIHRSGTSTKSSVFTADPSVQTNFPKGICTFDIPFSNRGEEQRKCHVCSKVKVCSFEITELPKCAECFRRVCDNPACQEKHVAKCGLARAEKRKKDEEQGAAAGGACSAGSGSSSAVSSSTS